jgi:hypothetical protein
MTEPAKTPERALRGDRLLELVSNPPDGMHWTCARCEQPYVGIPPENGICQGCHRPARRELGRAEALAAAGVPSRHLHPFAEPGPNAKQASWPSTKNGTSCTAWPEASGWCLVLTGVTGTGKSAIAAELLWRAMRSRGRGLWVRAADVADRVLQGNSAGIVAITSAPLVVLDELGIGHDAPAAWSAVESLICRLWEQETPTIITTNLLPAQLLAKSAPLADRLRDGIVCRMEGASLRGAK